MFELLIIWCVYVRGLFSGVSPINWVNMSVRIATLPHYLKLSEHVAKWNQVAGDLIQKVISRAGACID